MFLNSSKHDCTIASIAVCSSFASALFVALCWPRVRSVRRREQPSSVCLPGWADTVAAAQTADSCISLASSICYFETSDFITTDQCSCTLWLSPQLSALSVCLLVCHSLSWAVSNWILASTLIVHCAAFAMSSSFIYPFFYHGVHLQSACFSWVHALTTSWLMTLSVVLILPSFCSP